MAQKKLFPIYLFNRKAVDDLNAYLIAQIIEKPNVMIADEPFNFHTWVDKSGKSAEKADITARNNRPILEPIVENVSQKIHSLGFVAQRQQEFGDKLFFVAIVMTIGCSEMKVGKEINRFQSKKYRAGS